MVQEQIEEKPMTEEEFTLRIHNTFEDAEKNGINTEDFVKAATGIDVVDIKKKTEFLKREDLLEMINKEFDKFIVGEEETRKAIFICGCGVFVKNLNATFNILTNGESSAGKSWITKNVLTIFPEEVFSKKTYRTRISGKALTYWHNSKVEPEWNWDGKILYLEDIGNEILNSDVFKVMISEGSTATIVGKYKGKNIELPTTFDIEINGKPIIFVTTASGTPFDEIKNRFFLLDLDESKEQTEKIMKLQAQWAIKGKYEEYDKEIKDSLKLLERVEVILPEWINKIEKFLQRKEVLRWRREFPRLLELIKCSAALFQFQRERIEEKIIASPKDYEIAKRVISKINASSGIEGLSHREKRAYEIIKQFFKEKDKGCSRGEIYAYKPIYSDRNWERMLDKLANKGLLYVTLEINPETNRKSAYFYPNELENIELPSFEVLMDKKDVKSTKLCIREPSFPMEKNMSISSNLSNINNQSFMSITSINKKVCPSCDLETYPEDWNEQTRTCIFCNPIIKEIIGEKIQ